MQQGKDTFKLGTQHSGNNFSDKDKNEDNVASPDSDESDGAESKPNKFGSAKSDGTMHALSGLYAQIIVVVAATLVFTETLHGPLPLLFFHGYLFTYLVGGGIVCFLSIYISMLRDKCPQFMNSDNEDRSAFSTPFMRNLFSSDISVYLRIGAAVFGLGTLISNGLEVASLFTLPSHCTDELHLALSILRGLFTFLQLHFLFMNAREIVHYLGWLRHAALMHLAATNVALWIRLVLWESSKDWLEATHAKVNSSEIWPPKEFNFTLHVLESDNKSLDLSKHKPHHRVYFTTNCWWNPPDVEETEDILDLHLCLQNSTIGAIWDKAMPYLYPFIIQYCLVAAGVIYIIWSNLHSSRSRLKQLTAVSVYGRDPDSKSEMNCTGSTKGLFMGLLVLVAGLITLILFFVLAEDKDFNTVFVIAALRCGILGISALAPILGIIQIKKMKSKTRRQRRLAELLQRTGMLAVYVYGICNMIVGGVGIANSQHLLLFLDGTVMVIQACLQSLFIHQVLKKRLAPSNMNEKPGREVVMFLVFSNMVLWLFESFTTQHHMSSVLQKKFYGEVAWAVISRIVVPLVVLYRFHSAVALMEAWRNSYKIKQN